MTKPTDDKRLDDIRARIALVPNNPKGLDWILEPLTDDIAFLLEKIAEYEAPDGAPPYERRSTDPQVREAPPHGPKGDTYSSLELAPQLAPREQVREAESDERLTNRLVCGHDKRYWLNFGDCTHEPTGVVIPDMPACVICQLIAAREEGFKAGLKAAAEAFKEFWQAFNDIEPHVQLFHKGLGDKFADDILALPVTEIASRKE